MATLEIDPLAKELGDRFQAAGHELYLVGGVVRDLVSGRLMPETDMDFATDASPAETSRTLRGWAEAQYLVGVRFGTVGARRDGRVLEITTFREERYPEDERKPAVTFAKDIGTDLSRRDFTINAMAVRLPDGEFVDPYEGVRDLAAKRLDTPLDPELAFSDDPLRMLRAARFVSQLGVTPVPRVVEAIGRMRDRLAIVSAERIRDELDKLLGGDDPRAGLTLLVDSGLADGFLPELAALRIEQDPVHRHKDVLRHTFAVVMRCEPDPVLRLAALLHDVGKPATRRIGPEGVSFHHHEVVGARMAEERLRALRYPNPVVQDVRRLVELHLRFHGYGEGWSDAAVRRYVHDAGPLLDRLNQLTRADVTTRDPKRAERFAQLQDDLEERIARLAEEENLAAMRPPLDGRQVMDRLGIEPGPAVGEALAFLMDVRMDRGEVPEDEAYALLDAWAEERGLRA
ncbi:MAG TPA: CCA tRNA nucleotidyltransferase [Actinomycetota bacterium]|nr:CCA tRNA nucleotidyltransferase [Actinomycetota bacterium]